MKSAIQIEQLTVKFNDNVLFDKLNLNVKENTFLTILGKSGSGKSTLAKYLSLQKGTSTIKINDNKITPSLKSFYQEEILLLNAIPKNNLKNNTVLEYINNWFSISQFNDKMAEMVLKKIDNLLNLENIKNKKYEELSKSEKSKVGLLEYFLKQPKILILDDALSNLNNNEKSKILKFLKHECDLKKTTIISFPSDSEEILYADYIYFLQDKKIIETNSLEESFRCGNLFKETNQNLPFIVDLSIKLGYYDLVNKIYNKEERLIDDLWK